MSAIQSTWEFLESTVFQSRIKRVAASLSLVIFIQLVFSVVLLYFLVDISGASGDTPDTAAIAVDIRRCVVLTCASFVVVTLFCLFLWRMFCYMATRPLHLVNTIFRRLADGEIDWSEDIEDLPYPELGSVSLGYNRFMENIRRIIEDIRSSGIRIAVGSARVYKAVEIAGEKTSEQKGLSEQVAGASADGNIAIQELSENTNYVSENTSINLKKVLTSCEELESVVRKVESINRTVSGFGATIDELNRNSASIMEIIAVINDMSDQTNLLSLNATIEAARAGEYGKGFAVVAEEVRNLAKQIKPATEDISQKINNMIVTVEKTKAESDTIIDASKEVNVTINDTAVNFKSMIGDFEETNEQLLKIAAAIEELSLTNNEVNEKVASINTLSREVYTDMDSSRHTVQELTGITEKMQEMVSHYRTGRGILDTIISLVRQHRDHIQSTLQKLSKKGLNMFDENYRPIGKSDPPKFTTCFTDSMRQELQTYLDRILREVPGCVYIIPVDRKGYLPVHHSHYSKELTGNYEKDLVDSRNMRFFFSSQCDIRRATNTAPMLLQTYLRDTGEVLNDLSMPITVNGRHWGGLIVGLDPDVLTERRQAVAN